VESALSDADIHLPMRQLWPRVRDRATVCGRSVDRVPRVRRTHSPGDSTRGVVFKGSGWYITDSRPKSSGEGADGATKPASTPATEKADAPAKAETAAKIRNASEVGKDTGQGCGLIDGVSGDFTRIPLCYWVPERRGSGCGRAIVPVSRGTRPASQLFLRYTAI
jgi:predicted nucleic acid-binding Zn ribbon protein